MCKTWVVVVRVAQVKEHGLWHKLVSVQGDPFPSQQDNCLLLSRGGSKELQECLGNCYRMFICSYNSDYRSRPVTAVPVVSDHRFYIHSVTWTI